jgi:ketosteroid isomerase-like protein
MTWSARRAAGVAAALVALGVVALTALEREPAGEPGVVSIDEAGAASVALAATAEAEIRAARARFNQAIAARDTAALATIWSDDVTVIASTGTRIDGRDSYRERFAGYFADRAGYRYRREPERIDVFAAWGVATERGRWRAEWHAADGPIDVGGEYTIQWKSTDAGWLVNAELFTVLHCRGGSYCTARP